MPEELLHVPVAVGEWLRYMTVERYMFVCALGRRIFDAIFDMYEISSFTDLISYFNSVALLRSAPFLWSIDTLWTNTFYKMIQLTVLSQQHY